MIKFLKLLFRFKALNTVDVGGAELIKALKLAKLKKLTPTFNTDGIQSGRFKAK